MDGWSGVLWYAFYYNTGPYLMHSSDKVLFNPYTQSKVLSIESYQTYVVNYIMANDHGWKVTINGFQT